MALNIPNPESPGISFLKGVDTGSSMFSRLMQPVLEREKQKQQAQQFSQELAIKKQQESRLQQMHELKTNPKKLFELIFNSYVRISKLQI
jgi:cell shape-determining protein MreC